MFVWPNNNILIFISFLSTNYLIIFILFSDSFIIMMHHFFKSYPYPIKQFIHIFYYCWHPFFSIMLSQMFWNCWVRNNRYAMLLDNNNMVFRVVKQIYISTRSVKAFIDSSLPNIISILIFVSEKHIFFSILWTLLWLDLLIISWVCLERTWFSLFLLNEKNYIFSWNYC